MPKKESARVAKEIKLNQANSQFRFEVKDSHWLFEFTVLDGLYAGQTHVIRMRLEYGQSPDVYKFPINPPNCVFLTSIWHPNISTSGTICLDILNDKWTPIMKTASIITSIENLLSNPQNDSPMNSVAAEMNTPANAAEYVQKIKSVYETNARAA
jgi:ubiquitin-protein ligase